MTILKVKNTENGHQAVTYPTTGHNGKTGADIALMLQRMSPGYIEYILQFGTDPHCNACRDKKCENQGNGDDACQAFKFGEKW